MAFPTDVVEIEPQDPVLGAGGIMGQLDGGRLLGIGSMITDHNFAARVYAVADQEPRARPAGCPNDSGRAIGIRAQNLTVSQFTDRRVAADAGVKLARQESAVRGVERSGRIIKNAPPDPFP